MTGLVKIYLLGVNMWGDSKHYLFPLAHSGYGTCAVKMRRHSGDEDEFVTIGGWDSGHSGNSVGYHGKVDRFQYSSSFFAVHRQLYRTMFQYIPSGEISSDLYPT